MLHEPMLMEAAAQTDVGRVRSANEDAYGLCAEAGFFVVCDGMGGAAAGEVASQTVVAAMVETFCNPQEGDARQLLERGIAEANKRVFSRAEHDSSLHGMGTTLVSLLVRDGRVWIAHIGDSRCYRLRGGNLERMTQDHSFVDEQVRLGQMTPSEAELSPFRNVITRAVGTRSTVTPDIDEVATESGDLFLLCSDGLTREIPDDRLTELLSGGAADLQALCQKLMDEANASGGNDNITAILVRLG